MKPAIIPNAIIVIMAGGSGTRFWPLSDSKTPKQLLRLHGEKTLLEMAFDRAASIVGDDRVYVVSGYALRPAIEHALPRLTKSNYIAEPIAANTAACLGLAACYCEAFHGREAVMGVLTADHLIEEGIEFSSAVAAALSYASKNPELVTIGMKPTHADSGYGYLELGEELGVEEFDGAKETVWRVARVIEKPQREIAEGFLAKGNYLWNSGMFFWKIGSLLAEFEAHQPFMSQELGRLRAEGRPPYSESLLREVFNAMPVLPIDVAIMEKSTRVAAVRGRFGWQDVGSWDALARVRGTDEDKNCIVGPAVTLDSHGNIIYNDSIATTGGKVPEVVLFGVENHVVVLTEKAVMITPIAKVQDVKLIVQHLVKLNRDDLI